MLKKVIVASGNKIAIGDNVEEAIKNLLSQEAVSVEIETNNIDDLIEEIIKANKNLTESNQSNDWQLIGRDIEKIQTLITKLEELKKEEEKNKEEIKESIPEETAQESI